MPGETRPRSAARLAGVVLVAAVVLVGIAVALLEVAGDAGPTPSPAPAATASPASDTQPSERPDSLAADTIADRCRDAADRTSCLDKAILDVAEQDGIEAAAATLDLLAADEGYRWRGCHLAAHTLGYYAYTTTSSIATALRAVDGRHDTAACAFGYEHGAQDAWGRQATPVEVAAIIAEVCNGHRDTLRRAEACTHGLGHTAWPATDGDLDASAQLCARLDDPAEAAWCVEGALMAGWMPFAPSIPRLQLDTVREIVEVCGQVSEHVPAAAWTCASFSGRMIADLPPVGPQLAAAGCAQHDEQDAQQLCAETVGEQLGVWYLDLTGWNAGEPAPDGLDTSKVEAGCDTELQPACLAGIVRRLLDHAGPGGEPAPEQTREQVCPVLDGELAEICRAAQLWPEGITEIFARHDVSTRWSSARP